MARRGAAAEEAAEEDEEEEEGKEEEGRLALSTSFMVPFTMSLLAGLATTLGGSVVFCVSPTDGIDPSLMACSLAIPHTHTHTHTRTRTLTRQCV